jgi:hypothetical protein
VTDVQERSSTAQISESYEEIRVGDRIMPYREIMIPADARPVVTDLILEGVLVAARDERDMIWPFDVVYIDKGMDNGVLPGDIFTVHQPGMVKRDRATGDAMAFPEMIVGSIQVISVSDFTAAAYVAGISEENKMKIGDVVRLHAKVPPETGG